MTLSIKSKTDSCSGYDIFVIAGQSNVMGGYAEDFASDTSPDIFQLGRNHQALAKFGYSNADLEIIEAREPLQHHSMVENMIGFPLIFADYYVKTGLLAPGRKLLLIPCASGGVGFATAVGWGKNGGLLADLIERVNWVTSNHADSHVKGVLWHQGEADCLGSYVEQTYKRVLVDLITKIRNEVSVRDMALPFILGDLVASGVSKDTPTGLGIRNAIRSIPGLLGGTTVVETYDLTSNGQFLGDDDMNHFSSEAHLKLASRYFDGYLHLMSEALKRKINEPNMFIK